MRRIGPYLLSLSCVALLGLGSTSCTKAPEPKKAAPGDADAAEGGGNSSSSSSLPAIPEGPVATINGKEITSADFHAIYDLKLQKYADRGREIPKTADRRYRKSIVDRLIYQAILRQEAAKRSIEFDKAELQQREEAQQRGIKDWDKHLRRRGESEESLRQLYIAELLERAILEADGKLEVSEAEISEEYEKVKPNYTKDKERVRARHILVRVGPEQKPAPGEPVAEPSEEDKKAWEAEALKKAEEIYAKATAEGADFAQLAIDASEGPSARKGGDLGIFAADRMVEEFSDAAFTLEPGQISKPVKTKFGFHIIKVEGKYAPGELPIEALQDQLSERLSARKLHQGRRDLKESLLESYEVVNEMEKALGPDPRAERRKKALDKRQGHGPGARPNNPHGANPHGADPHGGGPAAPAADGAAPAADGATPGDKPAAPSEAPAEPAPKGDKPAPPAGDKPAAPAKTPPK